MDYQAGTSSFKEIRRELSTRIRYLYLILLLFVVVLSSNHTFADDPTENPLIETITVSATVLQNPGVNPPTQPIPPSPGPVNMTDTIDIVIFKGMAYPGSTISLLKNGILMSQIQANQYGAFDIRIRSITSGTYTFGLRAEDKNGLVSKLLPFTVYVSSSVATIVDGIFIPPTITSDKLIVKKGSMIAFSGMSSPDTEVRLSFSSKTELLRKAHSDSTGAWFYELDSSLLDIGEYSARARSLTENNLSPYSDALFFTVGSENKSRPKISTLFGFRKRCDLNNDNRVNLLDFSIMAFWYKRLGFPDKVDLNTDKQINLTDLSILAYCWTG